jgi:hypothetical protein
MLEVRGEQSDAERTVCSLPRTGQRAARIVDGIDDAFRGAGRFSHHSYWRMTMLEMLAEAPMLDTAVLNEVLTIGHLQSRINDLQIHRTLENADTLSLLVRAVDLLTQMVEQLQTRVSALEAVQPTPDAR